MNNFLNVGQTSRYEDSAASARKCGDDPTPLKTAQYALLEHFSITSTNPILQIINGNGVFGANVPTFKKATDHSHMNCQLRTILRFSHETASTRHPPALFVSIRHLPFLLPQ